MPLNFVDYESQLQDFTEHSFGRRKRTDRSSDASSSTVASFSNPASRTTTQSSVSSVGMPDNPSAQQHKCQQPQQYPPPHQHNHRHNPGPNLTQSRPHSILVSTVEAPRASSRPVCPTSPVQEWAHGMHIQQKRRYWWCTSCHPPRTEPLSIPSQKAMRRVRIQEPTHAYQ